MLRCKDHLMPCWKYYKIKEKFYILVRKDAGGINMIKWTFMETDLRI